MGILGGGTVLAAALGLAFQSLLAYWFGAGAETDAYFMSLSIFAFLAKLLMLTQLKSLALPLYQRLRRGDPAGADALAGGLFRLSLLALGALSAVALLAAPLLVDLLAPGYEGRMRELTVTLVRIRVPGLLFLGAITVGMAVLESRGRFGVTVSAQKLVPAALSLALLLAVGDRLGIVAVGWIGLAGTVAGAAVVLVAARRFLPPTPLAAAVRDPAARDVGRRWLSFGGSNGATLLGEWAFRIGASLLPVGLFSAVLYGRMVHDLLHGAVNDAAQTASLPRFAGLAAARDDDAAGEAERRLGGGLRRALAGLAALNLPVALFVALLAPWIVALLFGRGRFLEDGMVGPASVALALFAAGFLVQGLVQLVFAAAFAADRSALVNRVQIVGHLARAAALVPLVTAFSYVGLVAAQVGMNVLVLALLAFAAPRAWGLHRAAGLARALVAAAPAPVLHLTLVAPRLPDPLEVGPVAQALVLAGVGLGWAAVTLPAAWLADVPGLRPLARRVLPGRPAAAAALAMAALAAGAAPGGGQEPAHVRPWAPAPAEPERALRLAADRPPSDDALPPWPAAPLPDGHWGFDALAWLEARGALPAGASAFRPLGADRAADLLTAAARGPDAALAVSVLRRLTAEAFPGGRGSASLGAGTDLDGDAGPAAGLEAAVGGRGAWAWMRAADGRAGDVILEGGAGLRLGPVDLSLGRHRLTLGGGATGAVVANATAPVDGVLAHTPRPLDVPLLGGVRAAFGLGPVASYEAVDGPWLGVLRLTAAPAPWIQVGLSRGALVGGRFEGGTVPYDPVPIPADSGSLSAGDVLSLLAGRTTPYDDQVMAVDVRASLAPLGLPALAYGEVGWEDADRSWGDPGLVAGVLLAPRLDLPATLRYEYAAFGRGARLCGWCDTLPAFWYRHNRFQDGWTAAGQPLGHPLGGYGAMHRVEAAAWRPDLGVRVSARVDRLRRDRWNLRFDARPGGAWASGVEAAWRGHDRFEVVGAWGREWPEEGSAPARWTLRLLYLPGRPGR